jgi:hypothetical protein
MQGVAGYLHRSHAYNSLDPSEKGAISYFLGLASAKLLAERYLSVPWLMHLDVYKCKLNPTFSGGRSKPDLVGSNKKGEWVVIEAKGRSGGLEDGLIARAKAQTRRLRTIGGDYPIIRIALASFFEKGVLTVRWDDPDNYDQQAADIDLSIVGLQINYYQPFLDLFDNQQENTRTGFLGQEPFRFLEIEDADITVGMSVSVIEELESLQHTNRVLRIPDFTNVSLHPNTKIGLDGIFVELGNSWSEENMRLQPHLRTI